MRKISAWFLAATMMVSSVYTPVMANETPATDNVVMEETDLSQEVSFDDDTQQMNETEDTNDLEETGEIVEVVPEESNEQKDSDEINIPIDEVDNVEIKKSSDSLYDSYGNIYVEDVNALAEGEVVITAQLPDDYMAEYSVNIDGASIDSVTNMITLPSSTIPGTYTVTAKDTSGVYEDVTTDFTVSNYVLMNIPYADFYKADLRNDVEVDVFTSATKSKTANAGLAGNTYHKSDNSEILGVTFPVLTSTVKGFTKVDNESDLTTASSLSYAMVLTEVPKLYKEYSEGRFGQLQGTPISVPGATVDLKTKTGYGDYQLNVEGILTSTDRSGNVTSQGVFTKDAKIYGVIVSTENHDYGMRSLENIWKSELAWCTGFTNAVHNCPTSSAHYISMMGETIESITYITNEGIAKAEGLNIYIPKKSAEISVKIANAHVSDGKAVITATYPEDFEPEYSVEGLSDANIANNCISFPTTSEPGNYTLTVKDKRGVYADVSEVFQIISDVLPAKYDVDKKALVAADGVSQADFESYVNQIKEVKVDGKTYNKNGMRGQTGTVIVKTDSDVFGQIDTSLDLFSEEKVYTVTIDVTGFDTLEFQVSKPKSWKNLYAELGVDTSEEGEGYYDAVTSATKFTSFHAKDIPSTVNKEKVTVNEVEQTVLNGVNLTGKEASITPKLSSASHTDSSKYGTDEFVIVPDDSVEGYVWNDYITNLYAVTISNGNTTVGAMPWVDFYGEMATSGVHYNKIQISLNKGKSLGSNNAMVHRYDAFYDTDGNLKAGNYTVTLYAEGFKPLEAEIEVCEYEYMYAALTWNEYWASEGVMAAGSTISSAEKDDHDELDKGAFDAVTRATTVHGVHRGSYQCSATIYDTAGKTYELSHWSADGKTMYFTDGSSAAWNRGTMTFDDGSTATMDHYTLDGMKYVPVRIAKKDAESFKASHRTVANGESLKGGFGEVNLSAYELKAAVDKTTNGLKTVTKNADGTFSFSVAGSGKGSGTEEEQKTVDKNNLTVTVKDASGSYGEFLRVDLTGSEYGGLGSKMYAVIWKYYGTTDPSTNKRAKALATYGTKFAADNWMHKSNGIQLGLTESVRCQLPNGTDGTGYWQIVVKAMGYSDTLINFQVSESNIVKKQTAADITALEGKYKEAAALNETDYTTDSWNNFKTEYDETTDLLKKSDLKQSEVDEQLIHLNQAIEGLLKKSVQTIVTSADIYKKVYGQKAFALGAKANGKLTYQTSNAKVAVVSANGIVTIKGVGTAKITLKATATNTCKAASKTVTVTVSKAAQPLKVKVATKAFKVKKIKKKAAKFNIGASAAVGKVTYKSNSKKVKVTSKGVVTVKKGTKKGKYKITVTAAGNANYKAGSKLVTIIVK